MSTLIREEKFNKSDISKNNNKFWNVEVYDNGDVITRWGRVGETGQSKTFSMGSVSSANSFADKKIREKLTPGRNGEVAYTKSNLISSGKLAETKIIEQSQLEKLAIKQMNKSNNLIVEELLKYLTKVNTHNICNSTSLTYSDTTGLFSTPLGIVTQDNIDKANNILLKINTIVTDKDYSSKDIISLTNQYLTLIPQDIGRGRLDVKEFWANLEKVQAQKQILDSLHASFLTASSAPKKEEVQETEEEKIFDCQLKYVEDGKIFDKLRKLYRDTRKDMHVCNHLDVKRIYEVDINTVRAAFNNRGAKMQNIRELWHGTRTNNLISILKSGLLMPKQHSAQIAGAAFSEGIYAACDSTKSLQYSYGVYRNNGYDSNCFMFLIKMALGNYYLPTRTFSTRPDMKYDSCWAKASNTGFYNDEFIVYSTDQVDLNYLLEFSPGGK